MASRENIQDEVGKKTNTSAVQKRLSYELQKKKKKKKKNAKRRQNAKKNRFLITVKIVSSAGPIRFIVNDGDNVAAVIHTALQIYGREERLPVLGSHISDFLLLYYSNGESNALNPSESIGSCGGRNFVLCKKQKQTEMNNNNNNNIAGKRRRSWKAWLKKYSSFISFKTLSF